MLYRGRTTYPGLDQINVEVPELAAYSCETQVVIRGFERLGNTTTIPVSRIGSTCVPPSSGIVLTPASPTRTMVEAQQLAQRGNYRQAVMTLRSFALPDIDLNVVPPRLRSSDFHQVQVGAGEFTGPGLATYLAGNSASEGCDTLATPFPDIQVRTLNIGASVLFASPQGSVVLNPVPGGAFGNTSALGDRGLHLVTNSGGADVPPFQVAFTPGQLDWTNVLAVRTVKRAQGLTVTWKAPPEMSVVAILVRSNALDAPNSINHFCNVNASRGQFTIPPSILNLIPASPPYANSPNPTPGSVELIGRIDYVGYPAGLDEFRVLYYPGVARLVFFE